MSVDATAPVLPEIPVSTDISNDLVIATVEAVADQTAVETTTETVVVEESKTTETTEEVVVAAAEEVADVVTEEKQVSLITSGYLKMAGVLGIPVKRFVVVGKEDDVI
ncbi:hypothetical protein HDU76_009698, partial [Blyttiomyces sp. JEL0837]